MSKEALKLALEALEDIGDEWGFTSQRTVPKRKEAITAIKTALLSQRTWVGLDEEDYIKAYELCDFDKVAAFEFFESKLKEKNT